MSDRSFYTTVGLAFLAGLILVLCAIHVLQEISTVTWPT